MTNDEQRTTSQTTGGRSSFVVDQTEPPAVPTPDRLAPPPMPANPRQADYGAQVYYLVCMACHGDRGQGLTDEWRAAWAPGDQDCWQSRCHAANHPPQGYELPRSVPPVMGAGALVRFQTAADLYEYLHARMPWQASGSLQDEEYWQLTAFLANANGIPVGQELGPDNAANVRLQPPAQVPDFSSQYYGLTVPLLATGTLLLLLTVLTRRRRRRTW